MKINWDGEYKVFILEIDLELVFNFSLRVLSLLFLLSLLLVFFELVYFIVW